MQNIQKLFNLISKSIYSAVIDFELFMRLKLQLKDYILQEHCIEDYLLLIIKMYEVSNYEKLYQIKRDSILINQMAIELKSLVCTMVSNVIQQFDRSVQTVFMFPLNLMTYVVEIIVICTRICLNQKQLSSEVHQLYRCVYNAFEYVSQNLDEKTKFIHCLNTVEIMKYKLLTEGFSILQYQKRVNMLYCYQQIKTQQYSQFVENMIVQVLLKCLKCNKATIDNINKFTCYLTQSNRDLFSSLLSTNKQNNKNRVGFVEIYNQIRTHGIQSINIQYLYDFIKDQDNFNDDRLFQITAITHQPIILEIWFSVFNTRQEKQKQKSNIDKALTCFIYISQYIIGDKKNKENNGKENKEMNGKEIRSDKDNSVNNIIGQKSINLNNQKHSISSVLKLSNNVILMLLTQKKDNKSKTSQVVLNTIKTLVKIYNLLCFTHVNSGQQFQQNSSTINTMFTMSTMNTMNKMNTKNICLKELCDRLCLLCSRYNCTQICKVIYSLLLYSQLSIKCDNLYNKQQLDQIYEKFNAYHYNQKNNQLYKILKLAYDYRTAKLTHTDLMHGQYLPSIKKDTFISILFAREQQDMLILDIDMLQFKQIEYKVAVYVQLLKKYIHKQKNIIKILNHIQNIFIKMNFHQIYSYQCQSHKNMKNQLQQLKYVLYFLLKDNNNINNSGLHNIMEIQMANDNQINLQKSQLCFLIINIILIQNDYYYRYFLQYNFGILLNKYSKHVKIFTQILQLYNHKNVTISQELINMSASYLIFQLEKFKKMHLKKEKTAQAGEIIFIEIIMKISQCYRQNRIKQKLIRSNVSNQSNNNNNNNNRKFEMKKIQQDYILFVIFELDCLTNNTQKYLTQIGSIQLDLLKTFNGSLFIPKNLKYKILRQIIREQLYSSNKNVSIKQLKEIIEISEDQQQVELYLRCLGSAYGQQGKQLLMLMANKDKRIQRILLKQQDYDENQIQI